MQLANQIYKDMQVSTEIETASPHRQIQLLFEKFLEHLQQAKNGILQKNVLQKCQAISKALDIIIYLRSCLDTQSAETKELAQSLSRLYEYFERRLIQANVQMNVEYLQEVEDLMGGIKTSWDKIA